MPLLFDGAVVVSTDGRCFVITGTTDPVAGTQIVPISGDASVQSALARLPTQVRVLDGSFWTVSDDYVFVPIARDGTPTGPATVLPSADTVDSDGAWTLVATGGVIWLVGQHALFQTSLAH